MTETRQVEVSTYYMAMSELREAVLQYLGVEDGEVVMTDKGITVRVSKEDESAVIDHG